MKKLLIYIVAYNVQDNLISLLKRIPDDVIEAYDCEVLIIDNSSTDDTFNVAYSQELDNLKLHIKVLHNPIKQEYGGNQKLGIEYAIRHHFDAFVLLHGNGLYAPEVMLQMVSPVLDAKADMVIGSRVLRKQQKQRIPFYKKIGNRMLTNFHNRIHQANLTDFHSGYRVFSVASLKSLPFSTNSNDFLFDTQIIIQHLLAKKKIAEVFIPTYSGKEMYLFNCFSYGLAGIKATLASKLHQRSIFYKREYDVSDPFEDYSLKLGYMSSHSMAIDNTKAKGRVLDIGGGQGRIASELKKKGCSITGIDMCEQKDDSIYEAFYQRNLDFLEIDFDMTRFDTLLLLDIIEHLSQPEEFLDKLRAGFGLSQPKVILTTPNIGFFITRFQLLLGQFNYGKEGILDKTHKRLFTFKTLKTLCKQCGYTIEKTRGVPAPFPKALGKNILGMGLLNINRFLIFLNRRLFAYQIYIEIKPTPLAGDLLSNSISASIEKKK